MEREFFRKANILSILVFLSRFTSAKRTSFSLNKSFLRYLRLISCVDMTPFLRKIYCKSHSNWNMSHRSPRMTFPQRIEDSNRLSEGK